MEAGRVGGGPAAGRNPYHPSDARRAAWDAACEAEAELQKWYRFRSRAIAALAALLILAALLSILLVRGALNAKSPRGALTPNGAESPPGDRSAPRGIPPPARLDESERTPPVLPPRPRVRPARQAVERVLDVIRLVESGGRADPPDGDAGRSIGPYQVQRAYWADARVPWPYEAVRAEDAGRATVLAYWARWAPEALASGDIEVLARVHNGGPRGAARAATAAYWRRVETVLRREEADLD